MVKINKTASVLFKIHLIILPYFKRKYFYIMENTIELNQQTKMPTFGEAVTDHMFVAHYANGRWEEGQLLPFGNLSLSPMTLALHYGQSVFEGMKAYRTVQGDISIFRPEKHWERLNISLERFCMPLLPKSVFMQGLEELVQAGGDALPADEGALYIRPFVFAIDARFGYRVSETYQFIIFCGPVGPYYARPLKVRVETEYVRAAEGGTGFAKCAGNYGGAIYPTELAKKAGFDQVLWTDSHEHKYIEESGTMNVMFVIDGTLITPPLTTTILDGVTRDSVLQLAKYWHIPVEERKISVEEVENGLLSGVLTEAFGVGTAATVAPIATIGINDNLYQVPHEDSQSLGSRLKNGLNDIRYARTPNVFGWNYYLSDLARLR